MDDILGFVSGCFNVRNLRRLLLVVVTYQVIADELLCLGLSNSGCSWYPFGFKLLITSPLERCLANYHDELHATLKSLAIFTTMLLAAFF